MNAWDATMQPRYVQYRSRCFGCFNQSNVSGYKRNACCYLSFASRFGLAVRREGGKRKDLGSILLRLSFLFKKVVVCGHCLVTLSITSYRNIKMALIAAHLNAVIILVVTV